MKKKILYTLAITFMSYGMINAQKVILPYGQFSQQPWTGTFYFANSGEEGPADNWYAKDFNEKSWGTIVGPICSAEASISYFNTVWEAEYGTYWVRRHFSVNNPNQLRDLIFYISHDDGCIAYLNGNQIYNYSSYNPSQSVKLDETALSYLIEGDNVLALRVSDDGGINAYLDCGLYGYSLINGTFDISGGWTGSYDRYSYENNYIGYRYGQTFRCEQTLEGVATGLYCLSANACGLEYYNDYNTAYAHCNDELPAKLFIGKEEMAIPSAFSEMSDTDYGYCWNVEGKFVPYYVDHTPWAFSRGMYHCELWSFVQPDENGKISLGIYSDAPDNISRWAAWDNIDVTYYSENEVTVMLDSIVKVFNGLNNLPQNADVKKHASSLVANAKSAKNYQEKAAAFASIMQYEPTVRKSIKAYEDLNNTLIILNKKLSETNNYTSPATISEATKLSKEVQKAHTNGTYTNDDVTDAISRMEKMVIRLGYTYLDINVVVPGAMGDSILSKVENFVDVKSIKISGTLNDADLNTIQTRLSQLREIDMTGVNMTTLPNRFFNQRTLLEIVKLPAQLTTIGESAFYQCKGIENMDFPATLTTINYYAFQECDKLKEVILPEGFNSLGEGAFYSCDNIERVKLPTTLATINNSAFSYEVNLKTIEFAEGLTHIKNSVFYECKNLKDLTFPSTLYYIGDYAFAYNRSLSSIKFNEGLFQIADNAFYDCDALTEVTLPSSLVLANASPFDYCDNLRKVTCLSIEPPYMTDQIPYGLNMEGRELYVPALSINTYKQTSGWDKFPTIKPIDYLPENFTVLGDLKLTLPETIPADYKPNVSVIHDQKGTSYWQYGSLTVNGEGTLSMSAFSLFWDPNYQYWQYTRPQNYCSLVNNSHLRADNVSIDVWAHDNIWNFISFPFDVKMSDIYPFEEGTTNWVIRKYDGQNRANGNTSETWVKLTADDVLHAYEGYILQGSRYIGTSRQDGSGYRMKAINNANKNNIFRTTDITLTLNEYESEYAHNRSWNLIGNPYPCYYDTRFMDFEAPITVWNMRNSTYEAYSTLDDSYILCPGEAFFVQRPIDKANIVFSAEGRQTNRDARAFEAPTRVQSNKISTTNAPRTVANLSLSDGDFTDHTRIVMNSNALMQYEMDKDASKFMSTEAEVPQIYSSFEDVKYAINERPFADGIVELCVYIGKESLYTIALTNDVNDYKVVLEDKTTNKSIVLSDGDIYSFSAKAGTYTNRFVLHFENEATSIENAYVDSTVDDVIFSVEGIKVATPTKKGFYIQNGKKIMLNK